jgi:hypothetical protein
MSDGYDAKTTKYSVRSTSRSAQVNFIRTIEPAELPLPYLDNLISLYSHESPILKSISTLFDDSSDRRQGYWDQDPTRHLMCASVCYAPF